MMLHVAGVTARIMIWCSIATILFPFLMVGVLSAANSDNVGGDVKGFAEAAQLAYTAALAGAADRYSQAKSAMSAQISGEPHKPDHEEALASISNAYFDAIAAAQQAFLAAKSNVLPASTPTPTPTPSGGYFDWARVQSLAQKNLEDSVNWASEQYEHAKIAVGAAEDKPKQLSLLEQAQHNYYAGLGVAHARYNEFLSAASAAASSWTGAAPSTTTGLADKAGDNWDWLVAQVSDKVYGAPTPTPAWYADFYSQATEAPVAVQSIISELLVGKEPTYRESVLAQLAAVYSQATATVGSVVTEATQAVDGAIDGAAEALGNAGKIVYDQIGDMRDKVADTIGDRKERLKDEL